MRVKKLEKVLERDKRFAIFINGIFETEVNKETLMARFGQYKIKEISGGQFTETLEVNANDMCEMYSEVNHE